jgi:RNA polymerase sigma-70 factor (ECF subfamily)
VDIKYAEAMAGARAGVETPSTDDRTALDGLIQRCVAGDQAAWNVVIRTYWKRVFKIAYKFVARYDDAEDLTQEIFVRVLRALPTYDRRASFETWLTSVSRNHCIDHYRRLRRENARITRDVDPEDLLLEDPVQRPDLTLEKENQVALVRASLAKLSPTLRDAVALRDVHDLSYHEIAARLQLPEGTVKSRINRGRKELGKYLRELQQPAHANRGRRKDARNDREA